MENRDFYVLSVASTLMAVILTKDLLHTTDTYIKKLAAVWVETVEDFIELFPRAIEDREQVLDTFAYVHLKEKNTVKATIETIVSEKTRNGKTMTKIIIADKNESRAEIIYFTKPFFITKYKSGDTILIHGQPKYDYGKLSFPSPEIEFFGKNRSCVPVYSDRNYIPGSWFADKMKYLRKYIEELPDILPEEIRKKKNIGHRKDAILGLHFPASLEAFERAKKEIAYEELFVLQYRWIQKKNELAALTEGKSMSIALNAEKMKGYIGNLPFDLTGKQKIVLFQILRDMEKTHAMSRLLQGDVGTGKTIVAFLATLHAITEKRIQVAIMAPTEILARQHFESWEKTFGWHGISVDLLVGSLTGKQKETSKQRLKSGETSLIIWTHALIEDTVHFHNLGLVIIDEQHRFGVNQRKYLENYGSVNAGIFPHVLNMTATPIPRTLALTLYGDQDVSILNEYPASRKPIHTVVVKEHQRNEVYRMIEEEVKNGRQVFWISPLVEESETLDIANAVNTAEMLQSIFPGLNIWLVHGKMKPKEKDAVMQAFFERKIDILSSTSVVEVGVNNPNASVMCIEASERFWLSQLHQFRWRVGRWEHQSYCYLFTTKAYVWERLKALEQTNDGFVLSEVDLELRWPGEVYGIRQSGVPEFKIADIKDLDMVAEIREDIENLEKHVTIQEHGL
jgi:ATP-dependent DNA helicase RecG